ncbi:MAG: hypothetical protein IJU76_14700 [Desulfovibrionaceae bacterium]|nr:hypothetical protein [Desulfovibrionaceae bacterium]
MQKIRGAVLYAFFLVCMALQPFTAQADVAPLDIVFIREKPYADNFEMYGRITLIGDEKTHYYNVGRRYGRCIPCFILGVPGPCDYEVVLTPNAESMSTIRYTGEQKKFGPEEVQFHVPVALNMGERAIYSVRATIRLYRYSKKAKDSQNIKGKLWEFLGISNFVESDGYTYTFQDKKGQEFVLEDSIEVWKKEGKIYAKLKSGQYLVYSNESYILN